jgi:hypothetical protein
VERAKRAVAEGHGTLFAPLIEAEIKIYGDVFYARISFFAIAKSVTSERAGEIPRRPRSGPTSVHAHVVRWAAARRREKNTRVYNMHGLPRRRDKK